ncbi:MAG: hypothetical protein NTW07_02390 [candidate division Zixibacteria bacterium]|nr:hypothetical protein [candidate division Zixibacteria bacterium]
MCGKVDKLVKSHIIPEWAFKPLYDHDHKLLKIDSSLSKAISLKRKGEWDRIVCDECEQRFKIWDEYGRAVIWSKPGEPTFGLETQGTSEGILICGIDYPRMKLFELSVLWRAGVSQRSVFSQVDLGVHESAIREMLLSGEPGDVITYGCVVGAVRPDYDPRKTLYEFVDQPHFYYERGWTIVRFLFGGCIWMYVLHDDAHDFPLRRFFLAPGAPMRVMLGELSELPGLVRRILSIGEMPDLLR